MVYGALIKCRNAGSSSVAWDKQDFGEDVTIINAQTI
jgi:hypothetical protein